MTRLMMQPGSALLVMAVVAFFARMVLSGLPVIGGLVGVILSVAVVFGVLGGLYLIFIGRRQPT